MQTNAVQVQTECTEAWTALQRVLDVPPARRTFAELLTAMVRWEAARDADGRCKAREARQWRGSSR